MTLLFEGSSRYFHVTDFPCSVPLSSPRDCSREGEQCQTGRRVLGKESLVYRNGKLLVAVKAAPGRNGNHWTKEEKRRKKDDGMFVKAFVETKLSRSVSLGRDTSEAIYKTKDGTVRCALDSRIVK